MLNKKQRKNDNSINAGSMADIAFLLLIFFLVTTTIAEDQGITVKLPRWEKTPPPPERMNTNNVLSILVNSEDKLLVKDVETQVENLKDVAKEFISNPHKRKDRPKTPANAIVSLKNDRQTSYKAYIAVYNELKAAYRELRDEEAQRRFRKDTYKQLLPHQQDEISALIPLVISEAEPTNLFANN